MIPTGYVVLQLHYSDASFDPKNTVRRLLSKNDAMASELEGAGFQP